MRSFNCGCYRNDCRGLLRDFNCYDFCRVCFWRCCWWTYRINCLVYCRNVRAIFILCSFIYYDSSAATAPALVIVGLFMMSSVGTIDFDDYTESIPAFLTIIMMPFSGSIAEGIVFGMISYVVLKVITGRYKEVSGTMGVIAVLFVLRIVFM